MSAYLTVRDVADHFQVKKGRIERLIAAGQLRAVRIGHLLRLPRLHLPEQLPALPAPKSRRQTALPESGVYMLFREGVLIYIGRSSELPRRITNHRRAGRVFDEVRAIPCDTDRADWLEAELIRTLNPPENVKRFARRARRIEAALEGL